MTKTAKAQSDFEIKWAQIFLTHINKQYGFDYESEAVLHQSGIDAKAISKSGNNRTLNLELTQAKKWIKGQYFDADNVQESIDSKISKYVQSGLNVSDIILLLQGSLGLSWMNDAIKNLIKRNVCAPFKGIYYIKAPDSQEKEFVKEIKNAFN